MGLNFFIFQMFKESLYTVMGLMVFFHGKCAYLIACKHILYVDFLSN